MYIYTNKYMYICIGDDAPAATAPVGAVLGLGRRIRG